MKTLTKLSIFAALAGSLCAQSPFENVQVADTFRPNEVCIAIDPANTDRMVVGANINNIYYSSDGGRNWGLLGLTSPFGVWGDPVVVADWNGGFYFLHLSNPPDSIGVWIDRIVCQKSNDGGATWSDGTFMGLNGTKVQDKHWAAVNPTNNHIYVSWTQFDNYSSEAPEDSSIIRFSKSTDGGETWSEAIRLNKVAGGCLDNDETVEGAVPAIGPNGEIYISWASPAGIVFDRSLDEGTTWLKNDILIDPMPGGWDFGIPGIYRANGMPVTACDASGGKNNGAIYVNWADQRNGENDTDIWLAKSTDGGNIWSDPLRVNDDKPGKQQFFSWMDIDQTTGYIYIIYYDRRNYEDDQTDVYLAISRDGAKTFENIRISESPFLPNPNIFFGDYSHISAHNGVIRPVWTRLHDNALSVWTALISESELATAVSENRILSAPAVTLDQNYPNPFDKLTYISFKLHKRTTITLKIYDTLGKELATIIDRKSYEMGKYIESFDAEKYGLSAGTYFNVIESEGKTLMKKMILVK